MKAYRFAFIFALIVITSSYDSKAQSFLNLSYFRDTSKVAVGIEYSSRGLISYSVSQNIDINVRHSLLAERLQYQRLQLDIGYAVKLCNDNLLISPRIFYITNYKFQEQRLWFNVDIAYAIGKLSLAYSGKLINPTNIEGDILIHQIGFMLNTSSIWKGYIYYGNEAQFYLDRDQVSIGAILVGNKVVGRAGYHLPINGGIPYSRITLSILAKLL